MIYPEGRVLIYGAMNKYEHTVLLGLTREK